MEHYEDDSDSLGSEPATVLARREGNVLTITLNRPHRLNALSPRLVHALGAALEHAADDPDVRVVVLTGAGRGFCSGGDLNSRVSDDRDGQRRATAALRSELRQAARITQLLHDMPAVTVAAINGPCAGAGLSLACAADLRYCTDDAVLTTAFLRVAMSGDYGISYSLPRLVGPAVARELLFLSDRIDARRALAINLVNAVYPTAEFQGRVAALAAQIANSPARALRRMKANLLDSEHLGLADMLDRESTRQVRCRIEPDATRTALEFLSARTEQKEKLDPKIHGKAASVGNE